MSRSDRILFAGDPHGNFQPLIQAVYNRRPEAVVLLGDYDLEHPLEHCLADIVGMTDIWWIAGNHDFETPGKYKNLFASGLAEQGLHLKVTKIAGLRIAGLSGIFLGRVWYPPQPPKWLSQSHYLSQQVKPSPCAGLPLKYRSAIWHEEFQGLKALQADVLVSHEAPNSHRHGFSVIGDLALTMGVKQIFHGHLHENYCRRLRNSIHVCGVANSAVADLSGKVLG